MIKLICSIFHSRRDLYGNVYWAFRVRDTATGTTCEGHISGGESNITACWQYLGLKSEDVHYTVTELPIRKFNKECKVLPYAGCPPRAIARFIKEGLGWQVVTETFTVVNVQSVESRFGSGDLLIHVVGDTKSFRCGANSPSGFTVGTKFDVRDEDFEEKGFNYARRIPADVKLFKIAAISSNANSFCLYGHILVALDGEAWEVARAKGDWLDKWQVGTIIETSGKNWAALSCEIPHQRERAPQAVVAEVWKLS